MTESAALDHQEPMDASTALREPPPGPPPSGRPAPGGEGSAPGGRAPAHRFDEIYEAWFDYVWRTARRLGVPEASLDDVTQEVFLVVHRRLAAFEGRSKLKTWLFAIVYRVVRDHRRRAARSSTVGPPVEELGLASERPGPLEGAERAQAGRVLHALLDAMPDAQREVFVLAELEGLTAPEIVAVTGAKLNTVYSRLRLARAAFEAGVAERRAGARGAER